MKKIFYLAAAMSIALFASCNKEGDQAGAEDKGPQVTVATDALVLHLPFEDGSVAVGEGITFASKGGEADFVDGFIGKCYTNKSGEPTTAAYLKYDIAAENFVNDLESFTFSAWVKRPATGSGALFSINGGVDAFWWCTMQFIYDNAFTNEETGVVDQQFNGRFEHNGVAQWPNAQAPGFATLDKWYQVVRTYDAATSAWNVYVDGVKVELPVNEEDGTPTNILKDGDNLLGALNLANEAMNALYIGGWASFIEEKQAEGWMTFFNGSIDEVRMYNRALTDEEIGKLWQEEKLINLE